MKRNSDRQTNERTDGQRRIGVYARAISISTWKVVLTLIHRNECDKSGASLKKANIYKK